MRPAGDIFGPGAKGQTLSLTAFEEMFFWGDCPALPCLCYSRMRWSGVLDRRVLESAAQTALERHPLLRSRVELVDGETPRWIISPETTCAIDWQIGPLREEFAPEPRL